MRRALALGLVAAFGCADDADTREPPPVVEPDPDPDCEIPQFADDFSIGTAVDLPGVADRIIAAEGGYALCGDGFVALWRNDTLEIVEDATTFVGPCTGLATSVGRLAVASRGGTLSWLDISGGPTVLASASVATTLRHVAVDGAGDVLAAAGGEGVLRIGIAGDALSAPIAIAGATDARAVAVVGASILVADGYSPGTLEDPTVGQAQVRLIDAAGAGLVAEHDGLAGIASGLAFRDGRAVVVRDGNGFDVFNVTESSLTLAHSTVTLLGFVMGAAWSEDGLLLATGSHLVRYAVGADEATYVSSSRRSGRGDLRAAWFQDVAAGGQTSMALLGDKIVPFSLGTGEAAPQAHFESYTFTLVAPQTEALFSVNNIGTAPLTITGVEAAAPFEAAMSPDYATEREGCPGQFVIEPGEKSVGDQRHDGSPEHSSVEITLVTNDPAPPLTARFEANHPVAQVGDAATDFLLPTIDGQRIGLSDFAGKVVLAKLYSPL